MDAVMDKVLDQYELETSWSTRITDEVILEAIQGAIPFEMERNLLKTIGELNTSKVTTKDIYIKMFSILLKNREAKPIQAIATQLGHIANITEAPRAFEWGILLIKECKKFGIYSLKEVEGDWYVHPNFQLDKKTRKKLDKLQYLPPMKTRPQNWSNNHNGGWVFETKHLILGNKFTKHDNKLSYDVINKLQSVPWEIDSQTYLNEKDTNRILNKKKFLRVIREYTGIPFYFVWRYDSRGRSYSSGYDLNLQSNEYGKALLSMHKKELITPQGMCNLRIAIANHAGKDKLTWKERYDWANRDNFDDVIWDEPILGRKAVRALRDTQICKPSGYVMSLDATSSGMQVMAALSGCKKTASYVNMIDSNNRVDVYSSIATEMSKQLSIPVHRKIIKQAAMTHYYNSRATPKRVLSKRELEVFYDIIEGLLPGAEDVMDTINACWQSDADYHSWTMPDGHYVYVPVVEPTNGHYVDSEFNEISLRWYHQTKSDNFRSLCPNVIHSVDGYVAREMIRRCDFQLSHIHDCFVFNPNYLQQVNKTYRDIMAEIAKSDLLADILRQITDKPGLTITKSSTDLDRDIVNSRYMLS
jgi:hypothetical protein